MPNNKDVESRHIQRFFDTLCEENNRTSCGLVVDAARSLMKWHEIVRHEGETLDQLIEDAENRQEKLDNLSKRLDAFQRFVNLLPEDVFRDDKEGPDFTQAKLSDFSLLEHSPNMKYWSVDEEKGDFCQLHQPKTVNTAKSSSMAKFAGVGPSGQPFRTGNPLPPGNALASSSVTTFSLQRHLPQLLRERNPRDGGHHHFPLMNAANTVAHGGGIGGGILNQSPAQSSNDSSFVSSSSDQESTPNSSMLSSASSGSTTSSSSGSSNSSGSFTEGTTTTNTTVSQLTPHSIFGTISPTFHSPTTSTARSSSAGHTPTPSTTAIGGPVGGEAARRERRVRLRAAVSPLAASSSTASTAAANASSTTRERRAGRLVLESTSP